MQIYFIRHGETDFNRQRIVQGSGVDSSLNKKGQNQARQFFEYYKDVGFDVVLTSALKRTHETVKPFLDVELPHEKWKEINEMNWGIHEGKKSSPEMRAQYSSMIAKWNSGHFDARLEDGESALDLSNRLQLFVDHLKTRKEKRILVCSHGRALRCMMCLLKGEHLRNMEKYNHSNTGLFKVLFQKGEFEVLLENDVRHLDEIEE